MSIFLSIKRLFQHSAVYGIGHILNRLITFLLIPLYSNIFSTDLLGVYTLVFSYIVILTVIYSYGLDTAFFRFYIIDDTPQARNRIFSTAYISIFITSLALSGFIYFLRAPLSDHIFSTDIHNLPVNLPLMVGLAAGILFFDSLTLMPFLILRAEERPVQFIFFKFLNVVINFICNIVFILKFKMGIEGIFIANLASSAITFALMVPTSLVHFKFMFHWPTFKELFAFGIPYLPSTLSVGLMDTVDKIILEDLNSVDIVGLYGPNAKMGMFMALFITAFRFAWHPFFLSTLKQENAKEVFKKVFTYVLLACSFVFLFFSLFINEIVRLRIGSFTLLGKEYWEGTVVIPIIFLAYIFYAAYLNFIIGIYLEKKTKYLPFITGAGVLGNVIALYVLIPHIGFVGAAWARVIAYMVMASALYYVGQKLYPVQREWRRILKMVLVVAALFFLGRDATIPIKAVLFLLYPIILWIVRFFEKSELATMNHVLRRKTPGV
ncbi:polysaccharide biosynthesis C-terminal domain-containing protein [candidate division KSB1 bacterium]|nr:polysaccharide biosynthesis C-terminal domain-containing protein [candidate division KSB1 bacterium]